MPGCPFRRVSCTLVPLLAVGLCHFALLAAGAPPAVAVMMYGFGDDIQPLAETLDLVEDIVLDYATTLLHKARAGGGRAGTRLPSELSLLQLTSTAWLRIAGHCSQAVLCTPVASPPGPDSAAICCLQSQGGSVSEASSGNCVPACLLMRSHRSALTMCSTRRFTLASPRPRDCSLRPWTAPRCAANCGGRAPPAQARLLALKTFSS